MNGKLFNVAGPCVPGKHYMLPARSRCAGVMRLIDDSGRFDMRAMLTEFQQFWRENSDAWIDRFDYREADIVTAYLRRTKRKVEEQ